MENKKKREIEVKEEPEEEIVVKQSSILFVDAEITIKQEPEIYIQDELPQQKVILEREKTEDYDQSESKTKKNLDKKFQCEKCFKCFEHESILIRHQKIHEDERDSYGCDQCSESFDTRQKLAGHKRAHRERNIKCDKCERLFNYKGALLQHLKSHEMEGLKVFVCGVCRRQFNHRVNLQAHECVLDDEDRDGTLNRHLKLHDDGKYCYDCDQCLKSFDTRAKLTKEPKRVPKERKNIKCDKCNMLFTEQDLIHHQKLHDGKLSRAQLAVDSLLSTQIGKHTSFTDTYIQFLRAKAPERKRIRYSLARSTASRLSSYT